MASNTIGSFYYFAYGTYVDPEVMKPALAAVSDGAVPVVLHARPALLPGYRLVCDAVSVEGPRFGRLNICPYALVPQEPAAVRDKGAHHTSRHHGSHRDDSHECVAAFRDGVRGVLYELPANMRTPLLQAVAREGSFNVYGTLTCFELDDVRHGGQNADAAMHEALVIAALDLPLLERKYVLEKMMTLRWMALPAPQDVTAPPGLASTAAAPTAGAEAHKANTGNATSNESGSCGDNRSSGAAVVFRWPGLHWCNCISSQCVAPSRAYVAAIQKAYTEYLLLQTATEEDAEGQEKHKKDEESAHAGEGNGGDCVSYGQAIYRLVYMRARDTAKDPLEAKTWYFAYGSNLSWEQVSLRIGPPYQRRAVKLRDYVLVPNKTPLDQIKYASFGYCNVEPVEVREEKVAKGLVKHHSTMPPYVCGAAYEISMAQLEMMDGYERGYDREWLRCTDLHDPDAAPWDCWTYIAQETSEDLLPSREYLARVLEGADILPLEYIEGIRAIPTNPLRSPRQERRLRKEL
ncbi:hypothetical protein ABB37_08649 [Leptomonas pyrrhocoris]|uniref:gamma-glutamylcyclotransferase n=1 Tax=Leptomonas pyrrhocoris TaxID=157538 RepID=A0A0M9FT68_LEPPY|nr:hypothetical protein ABB37_08649 [Leptomonas pyrrhocoris]XP_015653806.1 hypothetical protein ABB37_08649 [Leptomonas pyrrhocoris]KPA75366.1 hypothetical protein ABB37_08649 [Leptomonas pyrrhocoris]KPA75367.1 hypothetical protein ABB37_08649 [Leptomonas pyrrhocoris]|eukprot:XP_015653805.1 hypothetical protein ABB37_08649 [Leptomonas pyrrhocoris]